MTTPLTETQFRVLVEQFVKKQGSQSKAARTIGISLAFLNDYLFKRRGAGQKLAGYFGFTPVRVYVRKEGRGNETTPPERHHL